MRADSNRLDCCGEVDQIARSHLYEVEFKIERLQDMKKELNRMIIQCAGELVSNCRLVEVLSDHRLCLSEEQEKP